MAEPVVLDSKVREVSVFRQGAVVTRVAELKPNGAWPEELSLVGLPLAVDDESVRVSLVGPAEAKLPRPADVRVDLVVPPVGESLLPPDEKELRAARDEVVRLKEEIARIDRESGRLAQIGLALPEPFENRPPKPAPAAAWSGVIDWKHRVARRHAEDRKRLADERMRAKEHLARLQRRLAELRASQDSREAKVGKRVRLRLRDADSAPVAATLRVEYRVPGARWVPTYVFRMARDGRSAQLSVKALVVQSSGEPWERVKLAVSTADLLRDNDLPELRSLRLGRRQPEPPSRAWREPPSGLEALFEGIDRSIDAMPSPPPIAPPEPPPPPPLDDDAIGIDRLADQEEKAERRREPSPPRAAKPKGSRELSKEAMRRDAPAPAKKMAMRSAAPAPRPMAGAAAPMPPPAPPAASMPYEVASVEMAEMAADLDDGFADQTLAGFGGGARGALTRTPVHRPDANQLRFAELVMAAWDDGGTRGKLRPATIADRLAGLDASHAPGVARRLAEAEAHAQTAAYVEFPPDTQDVASSSGGWYDHRYDAEGLVDVPGDGRVHSVPLLTRSAPVATTLVVVPRESTQAVRVAEMRNPLESPLLAGPAEIYLDDEFLVTSPIRTVPAGADLRVGLGVEEALKVARNVHFDEEVTGLLGGGASLHHRIEIELANRLATPAKVEVRERVPIKNDEEDKEVEISVPDPSPAWEAWNQADTSLIKGGRRWKLTLAAGEKKKLEWSYSIKIDAKNEVVGGNRRE